MVENVDEIVRKLTPKQRELMTDELIYLRQRVSPYKRQLRNKGLLAPCDGLTSLGVAVRARLNSLEGEGGGD